MKEIDISKSLQSTLENGVTIEVPYKLIAQPGAFWMFVFRHIAVCVDRQRLLLNRESAGHQASKIIEEMNKFTSEEAFKTRGLLEDGEKPSDAAFKQWATSLRWFLTVSEKNDEGLLEFSLGCIERNPWDGLKANSVYSFEASFIMDKTDGKYHFECLVDTDWDSFKKTKKDKVWAYSSLPVSVRAVQHLTKGSVENGHLPELTNHTQLGGLIKKYFADLAEKVPGCEMSVDPTTKLVSSRFTIWEKELYKLLANHDMWNGSPDVFGKISLYTRAVPTILFNELGVKYMTMFTAEGSYTINVPLEPIFIADKEEAND